MEQAKTRFRYLEIILSVNNMKEGFFFGFKGLTRATGDLFYSFFSPRFLFLLFLLLCSDVITNFFENLKRAFGCNTF